MKNVVEDYLRVNIDDNITIKPWDGRNRLPLYLLELYSFYKTDILGESCLLIEIIDVVPGIRDLKKHMKTINKDVNETLVFLFKSISSFRRKTLLENRIPFIVENGQMYLPFLGMDLRRAMKENTNSIKNFPSSAQLAYLYFLYNKDAVINATQLAKILKSTIMTASRVLNNLYSLGLLTYEIGGKTGRSKEYTRINDPDYYNVGRKYLKNPISRVVYVDSIAYDYPVAGLEALSMKSMLNPPRWPVRATCKSKVKDIMANIVVNRDKIADFELMEFQVWRYDPKILAENNIVDLVSLAMSLSEINDERVKMAIEERLRGEKWYTD